MADIAYIDDNKDTLEIVKAAFSELGLEIDIYDDPVQFYNFDKQYKLVISDYDMPNLNGQDFLKLLKEKYPKIKTVIYSGIVEEIKHLNTEIDSYLAKPMDFESLLKVVRFLIFEYDKVNKE